MGSVGSAVAMAGAAGVADPASAVSEDLASIPTVVLKRPTAVPAEVAKEAVKEAPKTALKLAPKPPPKETAKERRTREAREREAARTSTPSTVAAPVARGLVRIAISPWGEIEVDGRAAGTSPPLTELNLTEGRHQIVIRNTDLPPHNAVVNVTADQPVTLKHKF